MPQRRAIHFQYLQPIARVQHCSWLSDSNFFIVFLLSDRRDIVRVLNTALFVWKFIDCDLICGIYNVVIKTSVRHHLVVIDIVRENEIFWEFLSRSTLDLDVWFKTWGLIERYDYFTLGNIEAFFCHTGCN